MPRTIEQKVESFSKRLFVDNPEFKAFLLAVIQDKLYTEAPDKMSQDKWLRALYLSCIYYFTNANYNDVARHTKNRTTDTTPTRQAIEQQINKTLAILYARYTNQPDRPLPVLPQPKEKLVGNNYDVARFITTHPELTGVELAREVNNNYQLNQHARELLRKYGVDVPTLIITSEQAKQLDHIFLTSTNYDEVLAALNTLSVSYVQKQSHQPLESKTLFPVEAIMQEAGVEKPKKYKVTQFAKIIRETGTIPITQVGYGKRNYQEYIYYIVPASYRAQAVEIVKQHILDKESLGNAPVKVVAGPTPTLLPTWMELAEYPTLTQAFRKSGVTLNNNIGTRFLDLIDKDLCPVPIFHHPSRSYRYHASDEAALVSYLHTLER
jgi:hypothetical protein